LRCQSQFQRSVTTLQPTRQHRARLIGAKLIRCLRFRVMSVLPVLLVVPLVAPFWSWNSAARPVQQLSPVQQPSRLTVSLAAYLHQATPTAGYAPRYPHTPGEFVTVTNIESRSDEASGGVTAHNPSAWRFQRIFANPSRSLSGRVAGEQIALLNPVAHIALFAPQNNDREYTVVLDPGHGGSDPGTISQHGLLEKHLTLEIAQRVRHLLAAHPNIRIELTREADRGYSRDQRMDRIKALQPDLLISLHLNNLPQKDLTLVETYYAGQQNIVESERGVAEHVQQRMTRVRSPVTDDYGFVEKSRRLAMLLHDNILSEVASGNANTINAGVKQETLYILTQSYVPAALIELTCLSNADEELRLQTNEYRHRIAEAIARSILSYLSTPVPVSEPLTESRPATTSTPAAT